jgi:hypothetical protein
MRVHRRPFKITDTTGVQMSERDDMIAVVSRHLALWSVKDNDLRLSEINDVYGEEFELIEPTGLPLGPGRLGLHEHIGLLQKLLGDFTFEVDGDIDTHHGWATYAWVQRPPYNGRTVTGREVIHVLDGRITFLFMVIHDLEFSELPGVRDRPDRCSSASLPPHGAFGIRYPTSGMRRTRLPGAANLTHIRRRINHHRKQDRFVLSVGFS